MASDNFIVHIYRRDRERPDCLVGQIEDIDLGCKQYFHSMDKLWRILVGANPKPSQTQKTGSGSKIPEQGEE